MIAKSPKGSIGDMYRESSRGVKSTINNALKNPAKPTPKLNISKLLRKSLLTSHNIRDIIITPKLKATPQK